MSPWPHRHGSKPSIDAVSHVGRLGDLDVLDTSQVCADSSSSDSDIYPRPLVQASTSTSHGDAARPPLPQHSRSLSHPFPSLFSGKKKKQDIIGGRGLEDSDSTEDDGSMTSMKGKSRQRSDRNGTGGQIRDFATGNCMTCSSLVRWPRDLKVFKCTICLTINDLGLVWPPSVSEIKGDGGAKPLRGLTQHPNASLKHHPQGIDHASFTRVRQS